MRKWSPRRRKHWLKVASVEGRDIELVAREELGATVRECERVLTAARRANVDQPLTAASPREYPIRQDASALMHRPCLRPDGTAASFSRLFAPNMRSD